MEKKLTEQNDSMAEERALKGKKLLKDQNLIDRYLFKKTIEDRDAYKAILEIIMGKEISLKDTPPIPEMEVGNSEILRSIRLDVVAEDTDNSVFFTEMQKIKKNNLIKRSRFYSSQIDTTLLPAGDVNFNHLPDTCMILIAPFDLFDLGYYRYTFLNMSEEEPQIMLNDGTVRIFINTNGNNDEDFSEEFLAFMKYVTDSSEKVAYSVDSERLKIIHKRVTEVRELETRGLEFMQYFEELAYAKEDGIEEGIGIGRQEGLVQALDFIEKAQALISDNPMSINELVNEGIPIEIAEYVLSKS